MDILIANSGPLFTKQQTFYLRRQFIQTYGTSHGYGTKAGTQMETEHSKVFKNCFTDCIVKSFTELNEGAYV